MGPRRGGPGSDQALGVAVDAQGNCVVSGQFSGQAIFGKVALTSAGGSDAFVARLDSKGAWQWAMRGGSKSADRARAVAVDKAGEIYVVGQYTGSLVLGPRKLSSAHGSSGHQDVFLARIGPGGGVRWLTGVDGAFFVDAGAVALDAGGNQFVAAGTFKSTKARFGGTELGLDGDQGAVFIWRQ